MKLEGTVAVITGASRGVGRYMALELAREGADIAIAARSEEVSDPRLPGTIHTTAEEVRQLGRRAIALRTDVTDEASVRSMVARVTEELGPVGIMVNNAGVMAPGRLWEIPIKRWDLVTRVNVRGAVLCCQAVLPQMIQRRDGVIINISSILADRPNPGNISYSLTKQALRKLSEGLAEEVREFNVRVFALSPEGWVVTPGTMYHRVDETLPSGDFVEPPECMGRAAIYLCGDEAKELTGRHFFSRQLLRDVGAPC